MARNNVAEQRNNITFFYVVWEQGCAILCLVERLIGNRWIDGNFA